MHHIYTIVVVITVVLSSIALIYILKRNRLLNLAIIIAIGISSAVVSLLFPLIFTMLSGFEGTTGVQTGLATAFFASIIVYITLVLLLSMVISMIITNRISDKIYGALKDSPFTKRIASMFRKRSDVSSADIPASGEQATEDSWDRETENTKEAADFADIYTGVENILEKSVDTMQNTDKMGLGEIYKCRLDADYYSKSEKESAVSTEQLMEGQDLFGVSSGDVTMDEDAGDAKDKTGSPDLEMDLSISECIDEAFRLKENKDLEGAILYYMYALDRKPDTDLVFWIILDICVLYKALGQAELAREILESYAASYGDVMDESVKAEIERNLLYD